MAKRIESKPGLRGIPMNVHAESASASSGPPAASATGRSALAAFADLPVLLASAPHRMMFFAGASAVIVSMLWWACFLGASYFGHKFPTPSVPAGWAHAVFTQYGMLPLFMFGFLLTVFPRWMDQPALTRRAYVPVFAGVFGGYLLSHLGLPADRVAIERNLEILPKSQWIATAVQPGDRFEIVHLVGGG